MKLLISKGVDIESESDAGTPLIWAAGHGQQDAVKLLLQHGAKVLIYCSRLFFLTILTSENLATRIRFPNLAILMLSFRVTTYLHNMTTTLSP